MSRSFPWCGFFVSEDGYRTSLTDISTSAGSVTIASSDTRDYPIVDTNTFGSATDRAVAVSLFKRIRALMRTNAYAPIMGPEIIPGPTVQTDAQILEFLIGNLGPGYHGACTCQSHPLVRASESTGQTLCSCTWLTDVCWQA